MKKVVATILFGLLLCNVAIAKNLNLKENQIKKCKPNKSKLISARTYCITEKDILELGVYEPIKNLPEGMLNEFGGCKTEFCIYKKAREKVHKIFVQRTAKYHAKYPGEIIKGMAWFELVYSERLKKTQKEIKKYNYSLEEKMKFSKKRGISASWKRNKFKGVERKIASLIKMNNSREKMRKALGMNLAENMDFAIKRYWLIGEFLAKGKPKKRKVEADLKERKILINKYQDEIKVLKAKLKEKEKEK